MRTRKDIFPRTFINTTSGIAGAQSNRFYDRYQLKVFRPTNTKNISRSLNPNLSKTDTNFFEKEKNISFQDKSGLTAKTDTTHHNSKPISNNKNFEIEKFDNAYANYYFPKPRDVSPGKFTNKVDLRYDVSDINQKVIKRKDYDPDPILEKKKQEYLKLQKVDIYDKKIPRNDLNSSQYYLEGKRVDRDPRNYIPDRYRSHSARIKTQGDFFKNYGFGETVENY